MREQRMICSAISLGLAIMLTWLWVVVVIAIVVVVVDIHPIALYGRIETSNRSKNKKISCYPSSSFSVLVDPFCI